MESWRHEGGLAHAQRSSPRAQLRGVEHEHSGEVTRRAPERAHKVSAWTERERDQGGGDGVWGPGEQDRVPAER